MLNDEERCLAEALRLTRRESLRLLGIGAVTATIIGPGPAGAQTSKEPIRIGFIAPLSTANAFIGESMKRGAEFARDALNARGGIGGRKVELVVNDNANTNEAAVNALNKTLNERPVALILGSTSAQTLAMSPTIKATGVPTLILGSSPKLTDHGNDWIFATRVTDAVAAEAAVKYAVTMGKRKIAVFHAAEEFGTSVAPVIQEALTRYRLEPVAVVSAPSSDKDFSGQLLQVKKSGADVLLMWLLPAPGLLALKQMQQLSMDLPVVANPIFALTAVVNIMDASLTKNVITLSDSVPDKSSDPKVKAWVADYQTQFKAPPDLFSAMAYDSVMLIAQTVAAGGDAASAVKKGLETTKGYQGIGNVYTADAKRRLAHDMVIVDLKDKQMKILETVRGE